MKILERIINDRIMWWIEYNKLLPKEFYGFRKGRSCVENAAILITEANLAIMQDQYMGALYLDIKGAYGNVDIPL